MSAGFSSPRLLGLGLAGAHPPSVPVAAGSFTLTGEPAGLTVARTLTTAAGTFALTGESAGLTAARVLAAGVGSFAATGESAGLTYVPARSYLLTADVGLFALTGLNATLTGPAVAPAVYPPAPFALPGGGTPQQNKGHGGARAKAKGSRRPTPAWYNVPEWRQWAARALAGRPPTPVVLKPLPTAEFPQLKHYRLDAEAGTVALVGGTAGLRRVGAPRVLSAEAGAVRVRPGRARLARSRVAAWEEDLPVGLLMDLSAALAGDDLVGYSRRVAAALDRGEL